MNGLPPADLPVAEIKGKKWVYDPLRKKKLS